MWGRSIRSTRLHHRRLSLCRPISLTDGGLSSPAFNYGNASVLHLRSRSTKPNSRFEYPEGMAAYEDDWTEEPEYPAIDPETHSWSEGKRKHRQRILDWHAKIRNASCPEAKNLEINMPRQFGYRVFDVRENYFAYDCLRAYKYVTRTHVASTKELPSQYSSPELNEQVEYFKQKVTGPLLDTLAFELDAQREFEKDFNEESHSMDLKKSQTITPQINRVILSVLGQELDYLKDCQVDVLPRVEAFWLMGGQEPTTTRRNARKGHKRLVIEPDFPVEEPLHYSGSPLLQVRCKDPPRNFIHPSDPLCQRSLEEFPDRFPHFLKEYGFRRTEDKDCRFASIIPGHWSGDQHRCNLVAFHPRHHLKTPDRMTNKYWGSPEENEEAIFSQAMLSSFGRLVSQAFYHGFDQFTDLEYPFSTQTIITNGVDWSFFAYQMNTLKFDQLSLAKNQKQNVMWGTESQSIFDKEKKGELNQEVLGNLLRFYLNPPEKIQAKNPTPYLGLPIQEWRNNEERTYLGDPIMDWEGDKERVLTFWNFREQVCQRIYVTDNLLRCRSPEMYEWERIYKFKFKSMPLMPRRRWFELPRHFPGSTPWYEPYKLKTPLYVAGGIRRLRKALEAKKEEAAIEASKKASKATYGGYGEFDDDAGNPYKTTSK